MYFNIIFNFILILIGSVLFGIEYNPMIGVAIFFVAFGLCKS